jgi:excisionase family DNA binding protein
MRSKRAKRTKDENTAIAPKEIRRMPTVAAATSTDSSAPLFSSSTLAQRAAVFARDEFGVVEAGILLDVHPDTIRALVKSGKLPARRAGGNGKILISAEALDQFAARVL